MTGLVTVHGQLVIVKVVAYGSRSALRYSCHIVDVSYLGDGIGLCAVGNLSSGRAEGGVSSHNLSGVLDWGSAIASVGSSDTSHEGSGGDE